MATAKAKAKAPVKKTAVKKVTKAPVKASVKVKAKPKLVAKAAAPKLVTHAKPHAPAPPPTAKAVPPKPESVFARLLREKAERHHQFQKQNEQQHGSSETNRMPHNHASFSKFAGPRRRAS